MRYGAAFLCVVGWCQLVSPARAEIERIWLSYQRTKPTHLVVCWMSTKPGDSTVEFGLTE